MAINPYYIPAKQPLKQWGMDQYVPLPIEDINRFRIEADKKQQPLTELEGQFIDGEVFKSDIPAFQELQSQANKEISDLADRIDKYSNPVQYESEARKIVNRYTKPLGRLLQQKQYKDQQEALKNKYGTDAFYFGNVDPTQATFNIDPNTGTLIDAGYDPNASFVQRADHLKAEQDIADRVVPDIKSLGLSKSAIDYYLQTGTLEQLDQAKIDRVLTPENLDRSIAASPELQQRLRILTEQNSLNPNIYSGEQAMDLANEQLRQEIKEAAYQNVVKKLRQEFMVNQPEMAQLRSAIGIGEKEQEVRSEYNINVASMGKGKTTINPNDLGKMMEGTEGDIKGTYNYIPSTGDVLMITPSSNSALSESTTESLPTERDQLWDEWMGSIRNRELWFNNPALLSNTLDRGLQYDPDKLDEDNIKNIEIHRNRLLENFGWDGNPQTKPEFEAQLQEFTKAKEKELKEIGNGDIIKGAKIKEAQQTLATILPNNFREGIDIRYKTNDNVEKKTLWNPETKQYETFYEYKYTGYIPKQKAEDITTDIDADLFSFDFGNKQLSTILDEYAELGVVNKPLSDEGNYTFDGVKRVPATDFRTQSDLKWNYDNARQGGDITTISRNETDKDLALQVEKQQNFNSMVNDIANRSASVAGGYSNDRRGAREQYFYQELLSRGISKKVADKALLQLQNSDKSFELAIYDILSSGL